MTLTDKNEISTRWLITEAFTALLADSPFDKITVHAIVLKAGISRSTFYLHFQDKFDLLDQVTEQIVGELIGWYGGEWNEEAYSEFSRSYSEEKPLPTTVAICEHVRTYEGFYRNRFQDPGFVLKLSEQLRARLQSVYPDDTHATFAAYGTVGFIGRWLMNGLLGSSHDIALSLTSVALFSLPELRRRSQDEVISV